MILGRGLSLFSGSCGIMADMKKISALVLALSLALAVTVGSVAHEAATDSAAEAEAVLYGCQKYMNTSTEYGSSYCPGNVIWTPAQYQRVILHCKVRHNDWVSWHIEKVYGGWAGAGVWSLNWCDQKGWYRVNVVDVTIQLALPGWKP